MCLQIENVSQCVAVCCSVLQCVAVVCMCIIRMHVFTALLDSCTHSKMCRNDVSQCVAVYCSVLQCIAVCCSVLQ